MIRLNTRYPGRADAPSTNYPGGAVRNESVEGAEDGTPLEKDWANDDRGVKEFLLRENNDSPNTRVDTSIDSQVADAILSAAFGQTAKRATGYANICAGLPVGGVPWSPDKTANVGDINGACIARNPTNNRLMVLKIGGDGTLRSIPCWDYVTPIAHSAAWALTLPGTVEDLHDICSNGNYVFIAWTEVAGNLMVSGFNIETAWTGIPSWTVDTGLSAAFASHPFRTHMLTINYGYIGLITGGPGNYTSWRVVVIASDGSSFTTGSGNAVVGTVCDGNQLRLTTNGSAVFWAGYSGGTVHLCSAGIPNAAISPYTLATLTDSARVTGIQAINATTIVMSTSVYTGQDLEIWAHDVRSPTVVTRLYNLLSPTPVPTGSPIETFLGFDGQHLLVAHDTQSLGEGSSTNGIVARPICAGRFSYQEPSMTSISPPVIPLEGQQFDASALPHGRFLFDGRDLWAYINDTVGNNDAYFWRIVSPGSRFG